MDWLSLMQFFQYVMNKLVYLIAGGGLRDAFLASKYLRDLLASHGIIINREVAQNGYGDRKVQIIRWLRRRYRPFPRRPMKPF